MSITIVKLESTKVIQSEDSILTSLYGKIQIVPNIDEDKFTYFDSLDGFDLFVDETGENTVAIKAESLEEDANNESVIYSEIEKIKDKYQDIDTIKYDELESSIIIKVAEGFEDTINKIHEEYKNNKSFDSQKVTSRVLFLKVPESEMQLEDDDILNHLDDATIKNLASKTGTKLTGSESKDELKGIVKGALNNAK